MSKVKSTVKNIDKKKEAKKSILTFEFLSNEKLKEDIENVEKIKRQQAAIQAAKKAENELKFASCQMFKKHQLTSTAYITACCCVAMKNKMFKCSLNQLTHLHSILFKDISIHTKAEKVNYKRFANHFQAEQQVDNYIYDSENAVVTFKKSYIALHKNVIEHETLLEKIINMMQKEVEKYMK